MTKSSGTLITRWAKNSFKHILDHSGSFRLCTSNISLEQYSRRKRRGIFIFTWLFWIFQFCLLIGYSRNTASCLILRLWRNNISDHYINVSIAMWKTGDKGKYTNHFYFRSSFSTCNVKKGRIYHMTWMSFFVKNLIDVTQYK